MATMGRAPVVLLSAIMLLLLVGTSKGGSRGLKQAKLQQLLKQQQLLQQQLDQQQQQAQQQLQKLKKVVFGKLKGDGDYINPFASKFPPPKWRPYLNDTPDLTLSAAKNKDWASVVSACRAVINFEKRYANFMIRASFHDSLSVDPSLCLDGNKDSCGGADSSAFLSMEEMTRPENTNDNFTFIASRAVIKVASFYNTSLSDTLAVCALTAVDVLSGGRVKILGGSQGTLPNLRIGRLDSTQAGTPNQLPAATASTTDFATFWTARGFTLDEAISLMGSHSLIDEQKCLKSSTPGDVCDPTAGEDCSNVRMFRWENHFFKDVCTPSVTVVPEPELPPMDYADTAIILMAPQEFDTLRRTEFCKFTSDYHRNLTDDNLRLIKAGGRKEFVLPPLKFAVQWDNQQCRAGTQWGMNLAQCPHPNGWFYTVNDGFMAQTCQSTGSLNPTDTQIRSILRRYQDQSQWDAVLKGAYIKMVTKYARWPTNDIPLYISGQECVSGFVLDSACVAAQGNNLSKLQKITCPANCLPGQQCNVHQCCRCKTAFQNGYALTVDAAVPPTQVFPIHLPSPVAPNPQYDYPALLDPISYAEFVQLNLDDPDIQAKWAATTFTKSAGTADGIPPSPYKDYVQALDYSGILDVGTSCNIPLGQPVKVRGFPSSEFTHTAFVNDFKNPTKAQIADLRSGPGKKNGQQSSSCDAGGVCMDVYEIDIIEKQIDLKTGCPAGKPTTFMTYNGVVPGPTIEARTGVQTFVRFNNKISPTSTMFPEYWPCTEKGRQGRPISVHCHGMASVAPYDGWAEDSTCSGETKDYIYPNNRPTTGWYHDHQVSITADNAHHGLAGFYLIKDRNGTTRWGLEGMEELHLMLADKAFNSQCEYTYDKLFAHRNSYFGDINFVSGVPFPKAAVEPKQYRMRFLNAALSRPWLLFLVDENGNKVSTTACSMIGADGGYRRTPVQFPEYGLYIGVAERYDVVCDFSAFAGKSLWLWNARDGYRMKDVPYFCHSHLVMRFDVNTTCKSGSCDGQPKMTVTVEPRITNTNSDTMMTHVDHLITPEEYNAAYNRIVQSNFMIEDPLDPRVKRCDRRFIFARSGGQWTVNGDTWESHRKAADIGLNTYEVWCLETKGGWFHPVHIHLIDMYVLARSKGGQIMDPYRLGFEMEAPKDVVSIYPGSEVYLMVRWGPHRGEYMFHCHNLVHEDDEMMRSFRTGYMNPQDIRTDDPRWGNLNQLVMQNGMFYDNYRDPRYPAASATPKPASLGTAVQTALTERVYRIFYPQPALGDPAGLCSDTINPWLVQPAPTCPSTGR